MQSIGVKGVLDKRNSNCKSSPLQIGRKAEGHETGEKFGGHPCGRQSAVGLSCFRTKKWDKQAGKGNPNLLSLKKELSYILNNLTTVILIANTCYLFHAKHCPKWYMSFIKKYICAFLCVCVYIYIQLI